MRGDARPAALTVAAVAGAGLALRTWLSTQSTGSLGAALSAMSQYFTILTNLLVCVAMIAIARGARLSPRSVGGVVFAILVVGIVYHALLAKHLAPDSLAFVTDHLMHTITPLATLAWWLAFADRAGLRARDVLVWLGWPIAYCAYALVRGHYSGFYPYYFINLPRLGWDGLARSVILLAVAMGIGGVVLIALSRIVPVRTGRRRRSAR